MPSRNSIGCSSEFSREMIGRSCRPSPRPWPNCRPNAAISFANPNSVRRRASSRAIWSVVMPGLTSSIAASIHSRALVYASRCAGVARPTANVR